MERPAAQPSVFIGIPTKDRPEYVREAIESVAAQTHGNFRAVVSDNRSQPEASIAVESFVRQLDDPRITYVLQAEDGGEYGQGRYFFDQCKEDYLVILHDDDRLAPRHLECSLEILESDPELTFVSSGQTVIDPDGNELPELTREYNSGEGRSSLSEGRIENPLEVLLRYGGIFSISGTVFRFAAVRRNGLVDADCGGLYPFEFNVFLRQTESMKPAWFTPRKLVAYRHHAGTMRNYARPFFNRAMMATLMKLLERRRYAGRAERRRRKLLGAVYRNYAYILFVAREYAVCYRYLTRSIRLWPWSRYIWVYAFIAVFLPFLIRPVWGPRVTLD